jgi:Tol biopolymer transport system component
MDAKPDAVPHLIVDHVAGSAWSPAEQDVIAFADFDGHIGVVAPDGSGRRDIATFAKNTEFRDLAWSPDGKRLAFTAEKQRPSD